jgi:hypothetical protein
MMFCQLAQARSIREIIDGLPVVKASCVILACRKARGARPCPTRTRRPWQLYEAVFYLILELAQRAAPAGKRFRFKNG